MPAGWPAVIHGIESLQEKLTGVVPEFLKVTGMVSGPGPTAPVKVTGDGVMVTPGIDEEFATVRVTGRVFVAVPVAVTLMVLE